MNQKIRIRIIIDQMIKSNSNVKVIEHAPIKNKVVFRSTITDPSQVMTSRISFEDTMVACGYGNGSIKIYNLSTDHKIAQLNTNQATKEHATVNSIRWRPQSEELTSMSGVILVANTNGHLFQYAAKTAKELFYMKEEDNLIMALDYTPTGSHFATAGKDNRIRIYDQETKKLVQTLFGVTWQKHGHTNRLFSVKFKPDEPELLISGGWDQNINVWDRRQQESVATIYGPKISGDSLDIKGNHILSGANRAEDQLQLWDWRELKLFHTFDWGPENPNTFLFACQFCHNFDNYVIAAGGNQAKIFGVDTLSQLMEFRLPEKESLYSCDSSYSGNKYVLAGKSGNIYVLGQNKILE